MSVIAHVAGNKYDGQVKNGKSYSLGDRKINRLKLSPKR